ncbi:germacradienol/geosmin synthase [Actinopolyspora biskrensis]|uniref:Terpene synthase n=1 Tax=Actinopolyspora biskrensis TaxID=1470178 RepID=A0A852ZAR0_9ACTN|nr:germacradienol/geosmin synthase [Actinopolyspora biskrensis]NYH80616.1 germacradienol/geosmin synthase [Actinopolyspora biskrensis]
MPRPFELPGFYMPYSARLNPHVTAARVHSKQWALDMGMLTDDEAPGETAVWSEADFDEHDYALLCGYTHPDATAPRLKLVTDWYVWAFFLDDYFLDRHKRTDRPDLAGEYLRGLERFMPTRPTKSPQRPGDPVERGLSDLWARTAGQMSPGWSLRFAESTRNLFEGLVRELVNIASDRVPNPIDHIETHREFGGAQWAAHLVEYAREAELPPSMAHTHPLRVLADAFSDGVHLRNDLFSYQRETQEEGEVNNGVLVIEHFFECSPQRAADITNDLLTSRLHRFDETAAAALPPLFVEHALEPAGRADVLGYVQGLRDWQAGGHEWHSLSSRYMSSEPSGPPEISRLLGLPSRTGMSALPPEQCPPGAITDTTRDRPTGRERNRPFEPTDSRPPHEVAPNPLLNQLREHTRSWVERHGLLETTVWNEDTFAATDHALYAALTRPDAGEAELTLVADWHIWADYLDELFVAEFERPRDTAGARIFVDRLLTVLERPPETAPHPSGPAEHALAELLARTRTSMPTHPRRRFTEDLRDFLGNRLREPVDLTRSGIADPVELIGKRGRTGTGGLSLALIRLTMDAPLDDTLHRSRQLRELTRTFAEIGTLRNDLFCRKQEHGAESGNAVLTVQRFLGCDASRAGAVLADLIEARQQRFHHLLTEEIPALRVEHEPSPREDERLDGLLERLETWLAGELSWLLTTGRGSTTGRTTSLASRRTLHGPDASLASTGVPRLPRTRDEAPH